MKPLRINKLNLSWLGFWGQHTFTGSVGRGGGSDVLLDREALLFKVVVVKSQLGAVLLDLLQVELWQGGCNSPWLTAIDVGLGEDHIDLLQSTASSLWVEEENDWHEKVVHGSKEQVGTPSGSVHEDWGEHNHTEVGDPVGTGGDGGGHGSGSHWVDFWWVDPWQRQDRETEEGDEQEDTHGSTLSVVGGWVDQTSKGNGERDGSTQGTSQEQVSSAESVDQEERGDGGKGVDGGEHTTENQRQSSLAVENGGLEQHGGVVDGSVTTSELSEESSRRTNNHSLEVSGLSAGEQVLETDLGSGESGDSLLHNGELGVNLVRVDWNSVQLGQDVHGLVLSVLRNQPSWRLWQDDDTGKQDTSEEDLESDRESPLHGGVDVGKSKVQPVGNESAHGDDGTLQVDQSTSVLSSGHLGLPHRDGGGVQTITKTGDDSANDELAQAPVLSVGSDGDDSTKDDDDRTGVNQGLSANSLTSEEGEQGTEETTQLVTGSDSTSDNSDVVSVDELTVDNTVHVGGGELVVELGTSDKTGHQTSVVTEERETGDGDDCDHDSQGSTLEAKRGSSVYEIETHVD